MNIYVGNLKYSIKEEELQKVFEGYGQVESVKIIRDRESGKAKGYAFVEMPDNTEANKAITALDQAEISGRKIKVSNAVRKVVINSER